MVGNILKNIWLRCTRDKYLYECITDCILLTYKTNNAMPQRWDIPEGDYFEFKPARIWGDPIESGILIVVKGELELIRKGR